MRKYIIPFFFFFNLLLSSCENAPSYGVPFKKPEIILKDMTSFLNYWHSTLRLSDEFIPLDTNEVVLPKGDFFRKISTGEYLPLLMTSKKSTYKLFKIKSKVDQYIHLLLRDIGNEEYNNYLWEGRPLPNINLKDLNGNVYNQQTINGNILVLNFWFIHCTNCVAEMPDLNKLVEQYKDRKDISFLAIAIDEEDDLKKFLKKTKFNYEIISDTSKYLHDTLGIWGYPAQVLVNKEGEIVKIFSNFYSYERLVPALIKEASK